MPTDYAKSTTSVGFVLFEGAKLLDFAGPLQVFSDARLNDGRPAYDVHLLSELGGALRTDTVCDVSTRAFDEAAGEEWDTLLISGGSSVYEAMHSLHLRDFVEDAASRCRRLGSICLGAFVLAAGGHLKNRRATTHWDGCARLAARFPDIDVQDDAIFVEDAGVWTSAGVTAGVDMALEMVKRDLGATEALSIAKSLVLPMIRSGGQRQFNVALASQTRADRFGGLLADIAANLGGRHDVGEMATKAGMSERNFSRRFTEETGVSPARYVERLRVEAAADMLHHGDMTLNSVRDAAGFPSDETMRRAFHRQLGVSPSAYAAQFGVG